MEKPFHVGDVVELDVDADINCDYDEIEWLEANGVVAGKEYIVAVVEEHEEYDEEDEDGPYTYYFVRLEGRHKLFCSERFKLADPFTLENE